MSNGQTDGRMDRRTDEEDGRTEDSIGRDAMIHLKGLEEGGEGDSSRRAGYKFGGEEKGKS